ncbi:MAG: neutral zinc metallopeptidase [Actinomycetaceae bacterium]|nr:neutral zinc metallopeptidase [Actinomycetaceae bacterium]
MSFNESVQSDSGRVRSGGGGRMAGGLGGGSILVAIAVFLISQYTGVDLTQFVGPSTSAPQTSAAPSADLSHCTTGAAANQHTECRMVVTAESLDEVWKAQLPGQGSVDYSPAQFVIFTDGVNTACGSATSASGPFYCPADSTVYMDLGFFEQMESQFGAQNAPLAQEYVVAHEWGHHIQNLEGTFQAHNAHEAGPDGDGVRTELQADCYAGVWMHWASTTVDPESGVPFLIKPTQDQIADALATAEAIGDDRIQERYQGTSNPETWTHGSAEQRQRWLMVGLEQGSLSACNTFDAPSL